MMRTLKTYGSVKESSSVHGDFPFMREITSVFIDGKNELNVEYNDSMFEVECLCVIGGKNCVVTVTGDRDELVIKSIHCDGHHHMDVVGHENCRRTLGDRYEDFVGAIKSTVVK